MLRAIHRLMLALSGGAVAALVVALLEARAVGAGLAEAGSSTAPVGALVLGLLGVLFPLAAVAGVAVAIGSLLFEPERPRSLGEHVAALREGSVLERLRTAAFAPLLVLAGFMWTVSVAHAARAALAAGRPAEAGLTVGAAAVALAVAWLGVAVALVPLTRRLLALGSAAVPRLLDPAVTTAVALALVAALFALGVAQGDTGGGGGLLGIFGVLKRPELDLRPVANGAILAVGAYVATTSLGRGREDEGAARVAVALAAAAVPFLLLLGLCLRASSALGADPRVVAGLEKHAPAGRIALAVLRRASDRDRDGFSGRFGGGDCDDRDPRVNPAAVDVPGNGVDEDCSGADTPIAEPEAEPAPKAAAARPKRTYNVLFITVDTLRPDLGYLGYDKPVSPKLDELAAKATVFERAYAMASYTGKSVGPMMIGRYPSETRRTFSHFDHYHAANVFVAERARDAGVRTFAGMCHWYFKQPNLGQGFEVWDTSALPPGMSDNDTSVSSDRLSDVALKLLADPANVTPGPVPDGDAGAPEAGSADAGGAAAPRRFFAWLHYFDPHAQYVPHQGSPDFLGEAKGGRAAARALYDQEVWFTDQHIGRVLDYVASQPWGADTAVVVTADHGEAFGEHGMTWHGREIWEELVRVPLLVYVPGRAPRRVPQRRSLIDIAPTILELLGVPVPDGGSLRGKSLLEDVWLPEGAEHDERDVYVDMPQGPYNDVRRALITGPGPGMKLVHLGGASYQLFDLAEDPGEKKDLAADKEKLRPALERMQRLRGRLEEIEVRPP